MNEQKDVLMARPKKTEVDGNSVNLVEKTDTAYSVAKDPLTGDWVIVKIAYDFATGQTGTPEVMFRERARSLISERFKIVIGDSLL